MYKLDQELLEKYAKVMVRYALNGGKGINKGETVFLNVQECSKDLYVAIAREIYLAGGNVISQYVPDAIKETSLNRFVLEHGTDEQIAFFPEAYWKGIVDSIDHLLLIIAQPDIHVLEGISSEKISKKNSSYAPYMKMRTEKENQGKLSWTLCLYGTQSAADEAGLTLEEYWEQIIEACYLREADPVAKWKQLQADNEAIKAKLDALQIESVHVEGEDVDLTVLIGKDRKWLGGSGKNIPSFEVFISPDWRGTNGHIKFNQPLYYSGKRITGIALRFENGLVVESSATENEDALKEMISQENANKVGEFSLTDKRHSRITKFMANTLFDENTGGEFGNTHIALGNAYKDAFTGDIANTTPEQWEAMGFNACPKVHTDIVSTTNRTVTATLRDGTTQVIYKDGQFLLD